MFVVESGIVFWVQIVQMRNTEIVTDFVTGKDKFKVDLSKNCLTFDEKSTFKLSARLVWARGQVLEDQVRRLDRRMNCGRMVGGPSPKT
jgi:hypothetical protein